MYHSIHLAHKLLLYIHDIVAIFLQVQIIIGFEKLHYCSSKQYEPVAGAKFIEF